jgi:AraC-like DNA-binding protein
MSELAALVGISEKYFITSFRKALGITPGQYIYQIRMNRARDYLNENKYTVQQIASLLGYPDPFTFSKAFKKYYQVAPSRFE